MAPPPPRPHGGGLRGGVLCAVLPERRLRAGFAATLPLRSRLDLLPAERRTPGYYYDTSMPTWPLGDLARVHRRGAGAAGPRAATSTMFSVARAVPEGPPMDDYIADSKRVLLRSTTASALGPHELEGIVLPRFAHKARAQRSGLPTARSSSSASPARTSRGSRPRNATCCATPASRGAGWPSRCRGRPRCAARGSTRRCGDSTRARAPRRTAVWKPPSPRLPRTAPRSSSLTPSPAHRRRGDRRPISSASQQRRTGRGLSNGAPTWARSSVGLALPLAARGWKTRSSGVHHAAAI